MNFIRCRLRRKYFNGFFVLCFITFSSGLVYRNYNYPNETNSNQGNDISSTTKFDKNDYFVAAVIEYAQVQENNDARSTLRLNLQRYVNIVEECRQYNVDIIVFPEGGLFGYHPSGRDSTLSTSVYVPSAEDSITPCLCEICDKDILRDLSCAAIENNVYIAVTVAEKFCPNGANCQFGNFLLFVTEVVFDRNGVIIAKYRKHNLYTERWQLGINGTEKPDIVTFTTDFGVKFGIMICFDVAFEKPAMALVKDYNVTHIIHPMQFLSTLPFLPASTVEAGWSYVTDTFLLVSAIPVPIHTLGSNIYFGRRQGARTYMKYHQSSKIIISPVPKHRSVISEPYPQQFNTLDEYLPGKPRQNIFLVEHIIGSMTTIPIHEYKNQSEATFSYKNRTFECNISVTWNLKDGSSELPNYQLMAYSGLNNHSIAAINHYSEMCGVALCANIPGRFCLQPPRFEDSSRVAMASVEISAISYHRGGTMVPATYDSNLVPLDVRYFQFDSFALEENDRFIYKVNMKLNNPVTNLVAFGIYRFIDFPTPISIYTFIDDLKNKDIIIDPFWWLTERQDFGNSSTFFN